MRKSVANVGSYVIVYYLKYTILFQGFREISWSQTVEFLKWHSFYKLSDNAVTTHKLH
jgi:hypothetical protein